jgi:hypothetical protein
MPCIQLDIKDFKTIPALKEPPEQGKIYKHFCRDTEKSYSHKVNA